MSMIQRYVRALMWRFETGRGLLVEAIEIAGLMVLAG